jgi:hypothetical protein
METQIRRVGLRIDPRGCSNKVSTVNSGATMRSNEVLTVDGFSLLSTYFRQALFHAIRQHLAVHSLSRQMRLGGLDDVAHRFG